MKTKTFHGSTQAEAEQRMADWVKSQKSIKVIDSRVMSMNIEPPAQHAPETGAKWTVVVRYEDGSN